MLREGKTLEHEDEPMNEKKSDDFLRYLREGVNARVLQFVKGIDPWRENGNMLHMLVECPDGTKRELVYEEMPGRGTGYIKPVRVEDNEVLEISERANGLYYTVRTSDGKKETRVRLNKPEHKVPDDSSYYLG